MIRACKHFVQWYGHIAGEGDAWVRWERGDSSYNVLKYMRVVTLRVGRERGVSVARSV